VNQALGGYVRSKEALIRTEIGFEQIPASAKKKKQIAEIQFWERYRDTVLKRTRILDPACGSGAFLIAAFDFLYREYSRVNEALAALKGGQHSLFDLNTTILTENLFGVDLSEESVEITKLSLWLKTAERGKPLTALDDNIRFGNSIVSDSSIAKEAFNWTKNFSKILNSDGGFDVVIGNPPYVRQEALKPFKGYLEECYSSYSGSADLYVYFIEKSIELLRPNGYLSFIVTNKWLKAAYGEPLRSFLSDQSVAEQIIDFGHAPIFKDADTFPCIATFRKKEKAEHDHPVTVAYIPREKLPEINLSQFVRQESNTKPWSAFGASPWSVDSLEVDQLVSDLFKRGKPLSVFAGTDVCAGIKTGFNDAFLIDDDTRTKLIASDPKCAEIIKPYLRGEDIQRWSSSGQGNWIILLRSSGDFEWPWSTAKNPEAEFERTYPSIYGRFAAFRKELNDRQDQGKFWWELRPCAFYDHFKKPKIFYQEIQFHPCYSIGRGEMLTNNKVFFFPSDDLYLLAVLNSPLMWWLCWRYLPHMKDDALSPSAYLMKALPIADPGKLRPQIELLVSQLIERVGDDAQKAMTVSRWVKSRFEIVSDSSLGWAAMNVDEFIGAIKKRAPKQLRNFSPKVIAELERIHREQLLPLKESATATALLEQEIAALVLSAYKMTTKEVALLMASLPPRTPIASA